MKIQPQKKRETVALNIRIDKEVAERFERYCKFIDSEKGYVAQEMIRTVLDSDRDFAQHEKGPVPVKKASAA